MLENRAPVPCAALVQHRVPAQRVTRAALVRICTLRRHAMLHVKTSGRIMYDAVLVRIRKMSARAYESGALRRHAMLHIIQYPTRTSSACRHKPPMPLPFDWNKRALASQSEQVQACCALLSECATAHLPGRIPIPPGRLGKQCDAPESRRHLTRRRPAGVTSQGASRRPAAARGVEVLGSRAGQPDARRARRKRAGKSSKARGKSSELQLQEQPRARVERARGRRGRPGARGSDGGGWRGGAAKEAAAAASNSRRVSGLRDSPRRNGESGGWDGPLGPWGRRRGAGGGCRKGGGEGAGGRGAGAAAGANGGSAGWKRRTWWFGAKGYAAGEGIRGPGRGRVGLWVRVVAPGMPSPTRPRSSCRESTGARQRRARSPFARGRGRH